MDTLPPPLIPAQSPAPGSDKALAILCHISLFLGVGFLLPLIIYLVKRQESEYVAAHAREVLNFHISLLIYTICTIPLMFFLIGFPIFFGLILLSFICAIMAAIKTSDGGFFFYPLTIRFV